MLLDESAAVRRATVIIQGTFSLYTDLTDTLTDHLFITYQMSFAESCNYVLRSPDNVFMCVNKTPHEARSYMT